MKSTFSFSTHTAKTYSLIHTLLAALIGGDTKSAWIEILAKVISEIQLICILVSFPFEFLSNNEIDTLGEFVRKLAAYFSFKNVLNMDDNSIGTNIFVAATLFYITILILYIIAFMVAFYLKKNLPNLALKIWINLSVIHFTCTALYIHQCSITLIKEAAANRTYLFGIRNHQLFLWMGIFITVLNVAFAILTSRFVYEPIKSQYLAAVRTTIPDFLSLSYKLISIPLTILITDIDIQKWVQVVLAFVVIGYRLKVYVFRTPYYYFVIMRLFQCFSFIQFALTFLNLLLLMINEGRPIKSFALVYMYLIFCAFFAKLSDILLHSMISKYGMKKINEIRTKDDFYKKLLATDYILDRGSISSTIEKKNREGFVEFLYYGVVKAHKETCTSLHCGCNLILEKGNMNNTLPIKEEQRVILREFRFLLVQELFENFNDEEVKVTLANYLFENKIQSYAAAITIIHSLDLKNASIELKVIRAKLLEKIEEKVLTNYSSSIDIEEIVNYQQLTMDLRIVIEANLTKFLKFWETYKGADPSINELFKMTIAINKEAEEIRTIWSEIITNYSKMAYQDHLLFGLYQSFVRSAPYSAEKLLQKYFSLSTIYSTQRNRNVLITPENIFEAQNMIFYILMKKEQLGNIVFSTSNIEATLQYAPHELLNKNINTIMPPFYKEKHNSILTDHIDKSRTTIINRNRGIYPQKKNGYIIPATLFVSIFPYFQKQLIYIGILRPIQTYDEFLLVMPNGIIDCFTENFGRTLGLDPEAVRQYILKNLSKDLDKFRKAFVCLKNGDRERLRKIVYVNRSNNGATVTYSNTKHTLVHNSDQSMSGSIQRGYTSQRSLSVAGFRNEGKEIDDLFKDPEFDDWVRLYELMTSTGISVAFNKYRVDKTAKAGKKVLEFNTVMSEDIVYGSKVFIFRLQNTSNDSGQEDEFEEEELEESDEEEDNLKTEEIDKSPRSRSFKQLKGIVRKAKLGQAFMGGAQKDEQKAPEAARKSENLETEEQNLLNTLNTEPNVSKSKIKQVFYKEENTLNMNTEQGDDEWDFKELPDDNEVSPINVNLLQNVRPTRLISQASEPRFSEAPADESIQEGPDLERIAEEEQEQKQNQETEVPKPDENKLLSIANIYNAKLVLMQNNKSFTKNEQDNSSSASGNRTKSIGHQSTNQLDSKNNFSFKAKDDDKNSEKKHKLKKFFKEHRLLALEGVHVVEGQDRSSVSSSTRSAKISSRVEKAIYSNQTDSSIKILNILVAIFCLAVIGMIIYYLVMANININRLRSNVTIQKDSTQKLYLIVDTNRKSRIINIIQRQLMPDNRVTNNDITTSQTDLLTIGDSLSYYNSEIRLSINQIDKTERQKFYEKIPVYDRQNPTITRPLNSFDASTELVNSAVRINSLLPNAPVYNDPDLMFIIGNTLNDLLVSVQGITTILVDDDQINLQRVENTALVLMILTVVISACILIVVVRSERKFMRRKTIFLDSFFRIKDYEIDSTLSIVNNFRKALQEDNKDDDFLQKILQTKNRAQELKKDDGRREHRSFKAKNSDLRGLNPKSFINLFLIFVFVLVFVAVFAVQLGVFISYKGSINKFMGRVINTNIDLFQFGLIYTSLYEYISENGSTKLLNQPINTEWESIFSGLTAANDFFSAFDDQDGAFNLKMTDLLNTNLCLTLFANQPTCQTDLSGSRGILGINAFILQSLRSTKDLFDNSDRTDSSKTIALTYSSFIKMETIYSVYTKGSYLALDDLLIEQFYSEIKGFLKRCLIIGIVSIVVLLILVKVIWLKTITRMEEERVAFRNIIRVIPINVIMMNRYLKNYLIRNSNKILDTIKNKI